MAQIELVELRRGSLADTFRLRSLLSRLSSHFDFGLFRLLNLLSHRITPSTSHRAPLFLIDHQSALGHSFPLTLNKQVPLISHTIDFILLILLKIIVFGCLDW